MLFHPPSTAGEILFWKSGGEESPQVPRFVGLEIEQVEILICLWDWYGETVSLASLTEFEVAMKYQVSVPSQTLSYSYYF